jgi:hypothetical protein
VAADGEGGGELLRRSTGGAWRWRLEPGKAASFGREPLALVDEWPLATVLSKGMGSLMARGLSALGRRGFPLRGAPSVSSVTVVAVPSRWGALRVDRVGYGEHPERGRRPPSVEGASGIGPLFRVRSRTGPFGSPKRGRLVIPPGFQPGLGGRGVAGPERSERVRPRRRGYLVDPASSHMLVSKIKPCMSKYKQLVQ